MTSAITESEEINRSHRPLVSIIICCYNRASMLPATIESALAQDYPNTEIVLYDDGSTDDTPALAASYAQQVRYIQDTNHGVAVARTRACEASRGELIAFLDDDDLMPATRITSLYAALQRHPDAKFAVGEIALIDQQGDVFSYPDISDRKEQLFSDGFAAVLWPHVPATVHTTLFRRRDGEAIGWFDRAYDGAGEDKDFFARLGRGHALVYVPEVVSLYRRGHASLTGANKKVLQAQLQLFSRALSDPQASELLTRRLQTRIRITLQKVLSLKRSDRCEIDFKQSIRLLSLRERALLRYHQVRQFIKGILPSGRAIPL